MRILVSLRILGLLLTMFSICLLPPLLLAVLAAGMLVIMKYALMRVRLEKLVDERTEELRVQAEEFERQATHDKLTGLPNRRHADSYLQQQVDLAQRKKRTGALALADVDHFKHINDGYSHAVGDQVWIRARRSARRRSEGRARGRGDARGQKARARRRGQARAKVAKPN